MQIEELENNKEDLTAEQKTNLFISIVMGKDVTETIKTSRGDFKVKFPRMNDVQRIGRLQALRLNSIPAECFDANILALIQQIATLDVLVLEGPAWYENAKKESKGNFSWGDIPLQSFIQEVYSALYGFRLKVQSMFDENSGEGNSRMAATRDSENNDSPGLFDGLTTEDRNTR